MITTVIFDIGKVLIDFNIDDYMKKIFAGHEDLIPKTKDAIFGGGRWDRLDWGDDPEKVFATMTEYAPDCGNQIRYTFSRIGECFQKSAKAVPWLRDLKARGKKLYYLSNYSHLVMDANPECLDFLPLMDGGVFSCEVHMVKPNREIYECLRRKYNLVPNECVFIDDLPRNVQAGIDFGFHGIVCNSQEQAREDLNRLLEEE